MIMKLRLRRDGCRFLTCLMLRQGSRAAAAKTDGIIFHLWRMARRRRMVRLDIRSRLAISLEPNSASKATLAGGKAGT